AERSTVLGGFPTSALLRACDLEWFDGSLASVRVKGHIHEVSSRDMSDFTGQDVFGLDAHFGLNAGVARPGDLCVHNHQIADVHRLLERHRVDHGRDDSLPGVTCSAD